MKTDKLFKYLIAFLFGFLINHIMRGNGLMVGGITDNDLFTECLKKVKNDPDQNSFIKMNQLCQKIVPTCDKKSDKTTLIYSIKSGDCVGADLRNASLSYADLSNADLSNADLTNASLSEADLSGVYLSNASLSGAKFTNVNLTGAHLEGADLTDADLIRTNLSDANLSGAFCDSKTKLEPVINQIYTCDPNTHKITEVQRPRPPIPQSCGSRRVLQNTRCEHAEMCYYENVSCDSLSAGIFTSCDNFYSQVWGTGKDGNPIKKMCIYKENRTFSQCADGPLCS